MLTKEPDFVASCSSCLSGVLGYVEAEKKGKWAHGV
jgi:hypothetical protein